MGHFVELHSALIDLSTHEYVFCSALQFKTKYELLLVEVYEVVKHGGVLESEEPAP